MAISSYNIKKLNSKLDSLIKTLNGGEGSGNFGHGGRPGQVGGSSSTGGSGTKSDKALFESVKQMADIFSSMNKREGYKYSSSEDLVLKQGKFFTPETRPADVKLGAKKECFSNAARLALERSNLTYVEGYAMINDGLPLPIAHAWCVDKKGRVVDNTWENPGVAYFGVPFKTSYLAKKLSETGVYGILSGSVGSSDFLKDGVPSDWIADIKKQKNSYEPSIKDRLNNLIYKMNEATGKRGNPYHDEKGKFTFAPYQKYPLMEKSVKKLATLYKNRRDIYDSGFYDAVYTERIKLHQKYSSVEEMKKSDKAIEDWVHGDTLEHKEGASFSDIDIALSKSLAREFHNQQTVYRGQYDSDTIDSKSVTSWTPYEGVAVDFGKRVARINDAEKVSLFKIKTTDKNVILSPEIIYSVDGVRDWRSQQEFIVQAPKTKAYHTEDVDSINPYKRYDVQNSYIWNDKNNGGGNPYHDEKGRFTFGPAGVGASFYEPKDYYTRPDVKTTVGTFDVDHDGYLVVKERGKYVMENLIDKNVKLDDEFTKKNLENLTKQEISSLTDYTNEHGGINYSQVNKYMRTGEGSDEVKQAAKNISSALEKSRVGGEGMVFRGIDASVIGGKRLEVDLKKLRTALKKGTIKDATKVLKTTNDLIGQTFTDKAPMSTNAKYSSSYGQRDVVLAINVKKDTKGLDITSLSSYGHGKKDAWTEKFGSAINFENEVLLSPNTTLKFKKVTLDDKGVIIECDIESQK